MSAMNLSAMNFADTDKRDMAVLFRQIVVSLNKLGEQFLPDVKEMQILEERLIKERFHLAVLGQFKRGKSTLINALIGEEILPSSVIPLTAIPTYILRGTENRAKIQYLNGHPNEEFAFKGPEELKDFLSQYVTESGNPNNVKGVSHVEIFNQSPFLNKGVVLIDTPGIGSTYRHNTETTMAILSQCDAALFLVSADPPITEVEVEFLKVVREKVARLFFVLNKIDYLTENERKTVLDFYKRILKEQVGIDNPNIFCVSAKSGLEAREQRDKRLWEQSGMEEVSSHLIEFLAKEKTKTLEEALAKKALERLSDIIMRIGLTISSLQMPVSELNRRLNLFEAKLEEAKRQKVSVTDLLVGEKKRLESYLEEQAEELRRKSRTEMKRIVDEAFEKMDNRIDEAEIQGKLKAFIPEFFEKELAEMSRNFSFRVTQVFNSYQEIADQLIEIIRKNAAELFDVPYSATGKTKMFEMTYQPYWVTQKYTSSLGILPKTLLNSMLPNAVRRAKTIKYFNEQVEGLVLQNVENLRWATLQNLNRSFWKFTNQINQHFDKTIQVIHGAIKAAAMKKQGHDQAVFAEIDRLQRAIEELKGFQEKLSTR